jgi:hypothetical protein
MPCLRKGGERSPPFSLAGGINCPNLLIICAAARNESLHARLMAHMRQPRRVNLMNSIIYIVGLIVIVMAILSFIGLA